MNLIICFLATGLGSGYLKPGPGTWGSLLGLIIYYFFPISLPILLVSIVVGIFLCQEAEKILGEPDSPKIVWDEIVGLWLALWMIPVVYYPLAFLLFRFFDITKIGFIDKLQRFSGGWGIMLDDLAAGILTRIIIALVLSIS